MYAIKKKPIVWIAIIGTNTGLFEKIEIKIASTP